MASWYWPLIRTGLWLPFLSYKPERRTRSELVYNYCSSGENHIKTTLSLITALYYTVINYNQVTVTLTLIHVYIFILKFILFYLRQKGVLVYVKHLEYRNQSQTIDSDTNVCCFFSFHVEKSHLIKEVWKLLTVDFV